MFFQQEQDAPSYHKYSVDLQAVIVEEAAERDEDPDEYSKKQMGYILFNGRCCIHYQLQWLRDARIKDIIILCRQPAVRELVESQVTRFVQQNDYKMDIKICHQDITEGSTYAIKQIRDFIQTDFIYISMNSFTNIPPYKILEEYRLHSPSLTTLLYDCRRLHGNKDLTKEDRKESQITLLNMSNNTILGIMPHTDTQEILNVRLSLLKKYCTIITYLTIRFPNVTISTALRDSHIYIFKHWVLDLLSKHSELVSVHKDLVKILIQMQYRDIVNERCNTQKHLSQQINHLSLGEEFSTMISPPKIPEVKCISVIDTEFLTAHLNNERTYNKVQGEISKLDFPL